MKKHNIVIPSPNNLVTESLQQAGRITTQAHAYMYICTYVERVVSMYVRMYGSIIPSE